MNEKESIKLVPSMLNILSKIKPVEAPASLHANVIQKIEEVNTQTVPMLWVKTMAAAVLLLLVADAAVIGMKDNIVAESTTIGLMELDNYQLYHE
ncbi:MAG TPA: hypothetical protein DEQ56_06405 [Bacteroidetes bacterium]|mgnify:FL=1|jgi:hypothetical protein|nr:hypothetical protein [Bacteroidota bacterium]